MIIPMFTYFDIYAANNQINYPFPKTNMFQKEWKSNTTSEKKIVSTHPPLEEIKIKAQDVEIIASPFKHISSNEDDNRTTKLKDIKSIQQQNKFRNHVRPEKFQFLEKGRNRNFDYKIVISVKNPELFL